MDEKMQHQMQQPQLTELEARYMTARGIIGDLTVDKDALMKENRLLRQENERLFMENRQLLAEKESEVEADTD